ncbi:DUF4421 family protein [Flavobacterium orientale]|uniref:DUF4421 domain-containing protein n=1 Tax=Flavobacterium orientale TaxID=1756020 RepID=A0A916XZ45_9FLAO|nr:DUF4421 family protein [Flavobacterium orientale]GGD23249.1 hypothetical protein GCM10011343_11830 [Flavobacterium orientale]
MGVKIVIGLFLGAIGSLFAQQDSEENSHFTNYDDKLITSLYYFDTSNNFLFNYNLDGTSNYLEFQPNRREQIGVNLSYKFIDVSYGFSPAFLAENKDNSGSKLFTLSTRFYHKKWMQSLTFINQKGFYVSNGEVQAPFPRMRTTKIGGTTSYIFNDKFSFKTIANQKEWQSKSAGSFIPNLSIFYTNFDLNDGGEDTNSNIYLVSLAPSYFYNFVINNQFLLSGGMSTGAGFNIVDGDISAIYEWSASLKIGYNSDSFFTFVNLNYIDFIQDSTAQIRLNDQISTVKITAGYRFDPPKKVKEFYDKTAEKIGL